MPNWCVGDLKVRGKKENIKRFLLEGLKPVTFLGDDAEKAEIVECSYKLIIRSKHSFHVQGTRRNFIENDIEFYYPDEDKVTILILEDYKAAWAIESEPLRKLSEEYGVDFKILGFEQDMEFNQDIEIVQGKIIKDNEIEFDDYRWECIRPHIGG